MRHLPDYILRQMVAPGGTRLSKFAPVIYPRQSVIWPARERICDVCGKSVEVKWINGVESLDGHFRGGRIYYHNECFASLPGGWRQTTKIVPCKGNLENGDYRFWIGTRTVGNSSMSWGMCRCCRICTHSDRERVKHLNDDSCAVGGERCSQRLIAAYRDLLASNLCIVCKHNRYGRSTWGVPLCSTACEQVWMFSHNRYIGLEAILMTQKKKAEFMARQKSSKVVTIGNWCKGCQMTIDHPDHAEIHAQWEMMGYGE